MFMIDAPASRGPPANSAGLEPRDLRTDGWMSIVRPREPPPGDWLPLHSVPLAVLIPVKNEQANVAECIRRLRWAGQIAVVDSQSSDATVPIAQAFDAEVYQFHYSKAGWPKKKNWALDHIPWRHEWLLIMDADEHMTPELAREIAGIVEGNGKGRNGAKNGYFLNRRFMFMGHWIRHCGYYPSWNLHLFKHAVGRYERIGHLGDTGSGDNEVHEHVLLRSGEAGYLHHDFLHYAYPDLATWVEKHNRYSTWEAHAMAAGNAGGVRPCLWGEAIARRRWLKVHTRWLPGTSFPSLLLLLHP